MFLLSSFSALAASDNKIGISPDNKLYFLQQWKESIQTLFTFGTENKVKQFLHLADVRIQEYQKLNAENKLDIAQKVLHKFEKQLNNALQKISALKSVGKDTKDLSEQLNTKATKALEILQENIYNVPEPAKPGLQNAIKNLQKIKGDKTAEEKDLGNGCVSSGGIVGTAACCKSASNFPNSCLIGACGCSPQDSKAVKVCNCAEGKCFNGTVCVAQ